MDVPQYRQLKIKLLLRIQHGGSETMNVYLA